MLYTPGGGNSSQPLCLALELRELARPARTPGYLNANLGMFVFYVIWVCAALLGAWLYRAHPRFAKVRPLTLSVSAALASLLTVLASTLAFNYQTPCWAIFTMQISGIAIVGMTIMMRATVFSLEAQYARLVADARGKHVGGGRGGGAELFTPPGRSTRSLMPTAAAAAATAPPSSPRASLEAVATDYVASPAAGTATSDRDKATAGSALSSSVDGTTTSSSFSAISASITLFRLSVGLQRLDQLTIQELVLAKSNYGVFSLLVFLPVVGIILALTLAVPASYHCPQVCTEIFLEAELGQIAMLLYLSVFALGMLRLAYAMSGFDTKGVIVEIAVAVAVVDPLVFLVVALDATDPGQVHYNRIFNWQSIGMIGATMYIAIALVGQVVIAMLETARAKREDAVAEHAAMISRMIPILEANEELRRQFHEFAVKQYITESVHFLEDVGQFRNLYYEKQTNWRMSKVKLLVKHYIEVGSDLEINISAGARERILQRANKDTLDQDSYDIFNAAYEEVKTMVQNGAWREFMRERKHNGRGGALVGRGL